MEEPCDHRRKWDLVDFEQRAVKRLADEDEVDEDEQPKKRENLKQRDYKVDLSSRVGQTVIVAKNAPASTAPGYHCNVCDCVVKDSINFLDHINGKKHQRNLGMSMQVKRSTLDEVKQRFESNKQKLAEKKLQYDLRTRLRELEEEDEKAKEHRKIRRAEKKKEAAESSVKEIDEIDSEMAAVMGFSGFSSSKM